MNTIHVMSSDDECSSVSPALVRANYLENLERYMKTLKEGFNRLAIEHVLMNTSEPVEKALVAYLARAMGKK